MKHLILFFPAVFIFFGQLRSQDAKTAWDNTVDKNWPEDFAKVEITSSVDGKIQKAFFYKTFLQKPQPLIISLHTWSGDYTQKDPLAEEILLRGWNYIHPDFRGANNKPDACGSKYVVPDIEDAIHFAIENGNVDTTEIHIIGVSGGGYATLLSFMKLNYPVNSFHAWAPISNLEDWYWEAKGRGLKYARDLEGVTTAGDGFDAVEAKKRSPVLMKFQKENRENASLHIYTGVHDGYTGSVPVTHSINMFNHLTGQLYPNNKDKIVSDSLKLALLEKRMNPEPDTSLVLGGRKVHLHRELPQLSLTIFEGGHEMIIPQALPLLSVYEKLNTKKLNILTVGDSNAAAENGWPIQLAKLLPYSTVINQSISGNTIGFDNLGRQELNTLQNINTYLGNAFSNPSSDQQLDCIVFCLGTNDSKKIFDSRINEVPKNLDSLLSLTEEYFRTKNLLIPKIIVVSPPPMNEKIANQEKYGGGNKRIDFNNLRFKKVVNKHGAHFIDVNSFFKACTEEFTIDGVHLTSIAQFKLAEIITDDL